MIMLDLNHTKKIHSNTLLGTLFALPWCCIVPGILSLLGLAGVTVATSRALAGQFMPVLLGISLVFLGRAHYLLYIKKQGSRLSHVVTWVATSLAITVWAIRL